MKEKEYSVCYRVRLIDLIIRMFFSLLIDYRQFLEKNAALVISVSLLSVWDIIIEVFAVGRR